MDSLSGHNMLSLPGESERERKRERERERERERSAARERELLSIHPLLMSPFPSVNSTERPSRKRIRERETNLVKHRGVIIRIQYPHCVLLLVSLHRGSLVVGSNYHSVGDLRQFPSIKQIYL